MTFFNDTTVDEATMVEYFSPENGTIGDRGVNLHIASANAAFFADMLGSTILPEGVESKGHMVITSIDGSPLPQVVAKTYNVDAHGGTFGQTLKAFTDSDLIYQGESAFITGVENSSDKNTGFRTNVGVLNTSEDAVAEVNIHIYGTDGLRAGGIMGLRVQPNVLLQDNVFNVAFLGNVDMQGSVEIEVVSGGPVAAYASIVDNLTQDPILIPADHVAILSN